MPNTCLLPPPPTRHKTYLSAYAAPPQIYLTCGFNRWTHKKPVGPLALVPPDIMPVYDDQGHLLDDGVQSGSPTHWRVSERGVGGGGARVV